MECDLLNDELNTSLQNYKLLNIEKVHYYQLPQLTTLSHLTLYLCDVVNTTFYFQIRILNRITTLACYWRISARGRLY
jgi:hypothetical protein